MPKLTEVKVEVRMRLSRDYQSAETGVVVGAELSEGEDCFPVFDNLYDLAKEQVAEKVVVALEDAENARYGK